MHRVLSVEGGDTECTRGPRDAPRASPYTRRGQSPQTPQRQPTSRQARGERNFELCGRSSWWISAQRSVVGGRRVYVCIYRHLVNTCTSQAGPLRVKGNQLLPPPPRDFIFRPSSVFGSYRYKNKLHDATRRSHVEPYSILILLLLIPFVNM